ncbi:MAG: c-type cytochrome [Cyanobacteria bacterium SBLK]|nr:c-type cytochrome [Cyanobacteria bacterium SBLK]
MKKFLSTVLCLVLVATAFFVAQPAFAGDAAKGATVFTANCNSCHLGGKNIVMAQKTLQKAALEKYLAGFAEDNLQAIITQVTNGKGAMPSFKARLKPDQIEDVATYVLEQSEKW